MAQRAIKWSLDALQDKIEIYSYWIQKNKSVEYPKKLEKLFDEVAEMASIFPETGKKTRIKNVRTHIIRNFKVVYLTKTTEIIILNIFDTHQNPERFLKEK